MSAETTQNTSTTFQMLAHEEFINLTTFRKNGAPVSTPIWSAEHNGILYVETSARSGKVKRIRHTSHVTLTPCTASGRPKGESVEAQARIIANGAEIYTVKSALHRKYGLKRQVFYFAMEVVRMLRRRPDEKDAFIAIESI